MKHSAVKGPRQQYIKIAPAVKNVPTKTNQQLFSEGGDFLAPYIEPGKYAFVEAMREASVAGDWERLFTLWPVAKWARIPLGKFRFNWGPDGKPRYVPMSQQDMTNYFSGPWLTLDPVWKGVCPDDFVKKYAYDYYVNSLKNLSKRPNTHPHHIRRMYPPSLICKKKQGSVWLKVRKPVVAAAAIVTAVYLGPALLAKIKGLSGTAAVTGGKVVAAGGKVAAAGGLVGNSVLTGSQKLVDVVNKGRTLQAIAKGKLPPPPISISGSSWREWATLVAKDELQTQLQRRLTAAENQAIESEVAALQRQMVAATPNYVQRTPPMPIQNLSPAITNMQAREEQKADSTSELLKMALIVGIPAALLLGGS